MRKLLAASAAMSVFLARSSAILLMLSLVLISVTACEAVIPEAERVLGLRRCYEDGDSWRYSGAFLPRPDNPVTWTTNSILLQFNTNCEDVFGYGELVERWGDPVSGQTEISTAPMSFKGSRRGSLDYSTMQFAGTVYVDYDLTCESACEGYEPYAFDYPATWTGAHEMGSSSVTGWLDGYGDFLLDKAEWIARPSYQEVPGLEIWPKAE